MIDTAGKSILFDPFISSNPLAKGVDVTSICPDYMLISHGHGDHIEDALQIAKQSNCMVVGVYEITSWLQKQGVSKTHGMNIGGKWNFDFGSIKLTPALHSSTLPDGSCGGNPAGFLVENDTDNFYYSGDTGLFSDMALIGKNKNLKTAFLPIGDNYTMGVEDALEASKYLGVKHITAMHYDTFDTIRVDHSKCTEMFDKAGMKLEFMKVGSQIQL